MVKGKLKKKNKGKLGIKVALAGKKTPIALAFTIVLVISGSMVMYDRSLHITTVTKEFEPNIIYTYDIPEGVEGKIVFEVIGFADGVMFRFKPEDPLGIGLHHAGYEGNRVVVFDTTNTTYIEFQCYHTNRSITFTLSYVNELFGWL